jgi:general secretion pathway protein K
MGIRRDQGFALVAVVAGMAAFAYIAFQVLAMDKGTTSALSARIEEARLAAAADAGIVMAIHGLGAEDQGARWTFDGPPHHIQFAGFDVTVTVENEWSKAPLSQLGDDQARALFAGAGVSGDRLDTLVAEYHDWVNDAEPPPPGMSTDAPSNAGVLMRHGAFRTVGELAALRDMDPVTFGRIAPAVTVFFEEDGAFEPSGSQPLARAALAAADLTSPEDIDEQPDIESQHPTEELAPKSLLGRPMTVRAIARARDGAQTHRMEIVELTGDTAQPYWIRYSE